MKQPDQVKRRILAEWLRKADADIAVAEQLLPNEATFLNAVAFHCQQAAEKYIKAFLVWYEIDFPKTHDLEELLDLVETSNRDLAASLRDVIVLTLYGVELRYPGDRPDATPDEAREAVKLARQVRDAILPLLSDPPGNAKA